MIQVQICRDESELNAWLAEHSETCAIRDIKFGYCGTNTCTHERYMVIYERPSDYTDVPPLEDLLDEYYKHRKDWLDKDV